MNEEISLKNIAGDILDAGYNELQQLIQAYRLDKVKPEVDNFTEEGKVKYYAKLSEQYIKQAKELRKKVTGRVIEQLDKKLHDIQSKQFLDKIGKDNHKTTEKELLQRVNDLIYTTYLLEHGSPAQISDILNGNEDDRVLNLISAKINNLKVEDRDAWTDVINKVTDIKRNPANEVENIKNNFDWAYRQDNDNFPTSGSMPINIKELFEYTNNTLNTFIKK
jgi:molybdopterin converting factor small subunit